MPDTIAIIERNPMNSAEIAQVAATWKLPLVMRKAFPALMTELAREGIKPAGEPYTRYLGLNWDDLNHEGKLSGLVRVFTRKWNMLIGFPVERPVTGSGSVRPGTVPGGRYVRTLHRGPYSTVAETYKAMSRFIEDHGLDVGNESIEFYRNDPRVVRPEDIETEILIPIKNQG